MREGDAASGARLSVWWAGEEDALEAFRRTGAAAALAARGGGRGFLRISHRPAEGLSMGRFHRLPRGGPQLERRWSGGRAVAVGPAELLGTLVLPSLAWLDPAGDALGAERVLNRAIRPLLGALRAFGLPAYYAGRDLVTVEGRPIAHASFTLQPDGIVIVEWVLALEGPGFRRTGRLLSQLDPQGVAAASVEGFERAASLAELGSVPDPELFCRRVAEHCGASWHCSVELGADPPAEFLSVHPASAGAYEAFRRELGPVPPGRAAAVAFEMLGVVEATAELEGGRIRDLELTGDLLASVPTLDDLARALEGAVPSRAAVDRAVIEVLSRPRRFLLGVRDLPGLIERLA